MNLYRDELARSPISDLREPLLLHYLSVSVLVPPEFLNVGGCLRGESSSFLSSVVWFLLNCFPFTDTEGE